MCLISVHALGSLGSNSLQAKGAKHVAEVLTVNTTLTSIK